LSGSCDKTINVLNLLKEKSIKTLNGHSNDVTSLTFLNDETFASGCFKEIKIWSIKGNIECIKTIDAHDSNGYGIVLNSLGNDFIVSRASEGCEFKIWDVKSYECLKTYNEDSAINRLIVTKNQDIITETKDMKVNVWKISV
jgi:WD40 repeat protein